MNRSSRANQLVRGRIPVPPDADDSANASGTRGLVFDSGTVAAWTLVSRITGFLRIVTLAAVLGPTYFGNVFQTAVLLPTLLFGLLGSSLIRVMLVPPLVQRVDGRDRDAVRQFANGFLGVTILVLAAVVVLGTLAGPLLLQVTAAAVSDAQIRQQEQQIGWLLLAMLLPQILLYGVAAVGMGVQHAHGRFALAAAAPAAENLTSIMVLGASALSFGTGQDLGEVTMPEVVLLGLGTTASVAVHAACQWWGAYKNGVALLPGPGWRDAEIRRMARLAFTSSGYTGLHNLVFFCALVVAGRIPGGVIAFQTGYSFLMLPVALAAVPLASAQLPRLARNFNECDAISFLSTFHRSLALARFVALPASLLLLAASHVLAQALSFGEMGTKTGVSMLAACIGGLGVGVIGETAIAVTTSASYARRDASTPFRAMVVRAAVALTGMGLAVGFTHSIALLWALTLSVSIANLASAAYLYRGVMHALSMESHDRGRRLFIELVVSATAIMPGVLVAVWGQSLAGSRYQRIGLTMAMLIACGLTYLAIQWIRGSNELNVLAREIRMAVHGRANRGRVAIRDD